MGEKKPEAKPLVSVALIKGQLISRSAVSDTGQKRSSITAHLHYFRAKLAWGKGLRALVVLEPCADRQTDNRSVPPTLRLPSCRMYNQSDFLRLSNKGFEY